MSAKRKYEIVIFALYTIGAIIIGLMNLISLAVYLVVGLSVFMLFFYYKKKVSEQTEKYISKLTNRIKDSTEKGINKFPIGIIVIDKDRNIEWANNFIYKNIKVEEIKGLNILSNNGELAYQSVFHSHIHLIPRYTKEDGFGLKWHPTNPSSEVLAEIAQSIREQMEA